MPKTNTFKQQIQLYTFNATDVPWTNNANLYVSLHTSSPTVTGNQTTDEVSYSGYVRQAIARTSGGFSVVNGTASNAVEVSFTQVENEFDPPLQVTHFGVGTAASGTGTLLYFGPVTNGPVDLDMGITPKIPVGDLDVIEE